MASLTIFLCHRFFHKANAGVQVVCMMRLHLWKCEQEFPVLKSFLISPRARAARLVQWRRASTCNDVSEQTQQTEQSNDHWIGSWSLFFSPALSLPWWFKLLWPLRFPQFPSYICTTSSLMMIKMLFFVYSFSVTCHSLKQIYLMRSRSFRSILWWYYDDVLWSINESLFAMWCCIWSTASGSESESATNATVQRDCAHRRPVRPHCLLSWSFIFHQVSFWTLNFEELESDRGRTGSVRHLHSRL